MDGTDFRQVRSLLGLTQLETAQGIGAGVLTVKRWEKGKTPINKHYWPSIALFFERQLNYRYLEAKTKIDTWRYQFEAPK